MKFIEITNISCEMTDNILCRMSNEFFHSFLNLEHDVPDIGILLYVEYYEENVRGLNTI